MRAGCLDPLLRFFHTPRAGGEQNVPAAVGKRHADPAVEILAGERSRMVAEIVFEVVHAPGSEGFGVDVFVVVTAGIARAGHGAAAGIHSEFQPLGMDIVGKGFHAGRELFAIRHEAVVFVPFGFRPAVVDDDIFVPRGGKPRRNDVIRGLLHQLFVDLRSERVPRVPAHGRCVLQHNFNSLLIKSNISEFILPSTVLFVKNKILK